VTTRLAHQTQKTVGIPNGMRTATVTAVSGSAVTISVAGGRFTAGVGVLTSYAPLVGDTVAVFRQDSSWLILGPASPANSWHSMAALGYQTGWTDRGTGFPIGQYRQTASVVQLVGQITNAAIVGGGSIIVSGVPAPPGEVSGMICSQAGTRPNLRVDSNGNLRLDNATVSGTLQFCCSYPIDCVIA